MSLRLMDLTDSYIFPVGNIKKNLWNNIYKEPYIHERNIAYTYNRRLCGKAITDMDIYILVPIRYLLTNFL